MRLYEHWGYVVVAGYIQPLDASPWTLKCFKLFCIISLPGCATQMFWTHPITGSPSENFGLVGSGNGDCHHFLPRWRRHFGGFLSDGALRVGVVVVQLRFFDSHWYLTHLRYLCGSVDAFTVVLVWWSERQSANGLLFFAVVGFGSRFGSTFTSCEVGSFRGDLTILTFCHWNSLLQILGSFF